MLEFLTPSNVIQLVKALLDIGIMSIIIYYALRIVRNNARTVQIFKGILFVFIANMLAKIFGFSTVRNFTEVFMTWGIVVVIIIFQPEIRSVLERLGKSSVFAAQSDLSLSERDELISELCDAVQELSEQKTGALITIEQNTSLDDYIKTGTYLNSYVSKELLKSIFVVGTPLHDGAVIIQGNKIAAAAAFFPPTEEWLPSKYGARHRAGIGISEVSDSVTIIVSEETGLISIAQDGRMSLINSKELSAYLHKVIFEQETEVLVKKVEKDASKARVEKIENEIINEQKEELETSRIIKQFTKVKQEVEEGDDDVE